MTDETPVLATVTPIAAAVPPVVELQPAKIPAEVASGVPAGSHVVVTLHAPADSASGPTPTPATPALRSRQRKLSVAVRLETGLARIVPYCGYQLLRLGPAGLAGVAATLAAIAIGIITLVSVRNETDTLTSQIARAQQHPGAENTPEDVLGKVITALPTREQMPAILGRVLQQASLAGVVLTTGHYTYSPPNVGEVGRYELEFPLKAEYPSVRDFIDRTLSTVPSAGLDKLHIERKAVGDTVVNANVRFVVFIRNGRER